MESVLLLLAALPAFLLALPRLCEVLLRLISICERLISWSKEKALLQWIDDLEATLDKLDKAQTPEEKRTAARGMVDLIRKLG
jgi:hypothetical protein